MKTKCLTKYSTFANLRWPAALAIALATTFLAAPLAPAQIIQHGDIVVPIGRSRIQVYSQDFTPKGTFPHMTDSALTGDAMVLPDHSPLLALFDANNVGKFTSAGASDGTFGNVPYDAQPNSFACGGNPYVYVGQETGTGDVLKFDSAGNWLARYDVQPVGPRGSAWIDIVDPVIWYVTGPGPIKRWNMTPPGTEMADYGAGQINNAEEFKIIPAGGIPNFGGQVIVADPPNLKRISGADGTFTEALYFTPGQVYPTAVALDPDGVHVWTADRATALVIRYNIEVATEVTSFPLTAVLPLLDVSGLAIDGERTTCGGNTPTPPGLPGRMTGGGSVFTASGTRVTHGFTLRCDMLDRPQQLTVHWPDNKFKLTAVSSSSCSDDPTITPSPARPGFDTHSGTGTGEFNGMPGAMITWKFTDAGEPGTTDRCTMEIRNQFGVPVLVVDGFLQNGNHRAHN